MVIDTFSTMGKVSLLMQVLLIGRQDGMFISKQKVGFIWKPRKRLVLASSDELQNAMERLLPSTLLPAKKRETQKLAVQS